MSMYNAKSVFVHVCPAGLCLCEALVATTQSVSSNLSVIRSRFPLEMEFPMDTELARELAEFESMALAFSTSMRMRCLALWCEIEGGDGHHPQSAE